MATATELLITAAIVYFLHQCFMFYRIRSKIRNIPTVGSDNFLGATLDSLKFILRGHESIKEGYLKYKGMAFKIPTITTSSGWLIVVDGEQMIEELRKAPSDVLSFSETTVDLMQSEIVFGKHAHAHEFHVAVVKSPLTRAFPSRFAEIADEIVESCNQYLPNGSDWVSLNLQKNLIHIVCRTSNRLFVGLPLCRNPEYRKIQEDWTVHVMIAAHVTHLFPKALKPIAKLLVGKVDSMTRKVEKFLGPIIIERLEKDAKYGPKWEGRPSDLISWLIDLAPPEHKNVEDITIRVMLINFAAIHTTSLTLTNALLDVAARTEYIKPLRKEMEEVIGNHGWTKEAMGRMWKLDSVIKESSRLYGVSEIAVARKAVKDFTFSNGLTIPVGYTVAAASSGVHTDPTIYEDPNSFNGFRFSEMRQNGTNEYDPLRHQMVSLDSSYLLFGHGRNACPGRFLAVNEVKAMMAHILLNYDIKLPGDSKEIPPGKYFAGARTPAPNAEIMFRKRKRD
ncbi:hypothetical protein EST38_g14220 [Candolleomyces aberdarensis]|uniref:Cytochrome P450 n=1 Tax=Candolleomyces aberdarensis TaxID=2316362 RepID=A0A4Q2CZP2_9AGAR|nr:hypothetical protein EST38_g14220 [Candolleomyces aberdarensis]